MIEYGCAGCKYYAGTIWLGEDRFVDCAHPTEPGHKDVHPSRGCGLRIAKDGAGEQQKSLFG